MADHGQVLLHLRLSNFYFVQDFHHQQETALLQRPTVALTVLLNFFLVPAWIRHSCKRSSPK